MKQKLQTGSVKKSAIMLSLLLALLMAFGAPLSAGRVYAGVNNDQPRYYTDYNTIAEVNAAANAFNIEMAKESYVLMKNENNTLPLTTAAEKRVTMLGGSMARLIAGGGGSGGGSGTARTVKESMEASGFKINPFVWNVLPTAAANNNNDKEVNSSIIGVKSIEASYKDYDGAAIISISRYGSEFNDAAIYNISGHTNKFDHAYTLFDSERTLIDYVADRFEKVIILINSAHAIELGDLQDDPRIGAILWIGHNGASGIMALGPILSGEVNPSGRTVDVYASQFANDPTYPNYAGNVQGNELRVRLSNESETDVFIYERDYSDAPANLAAMLADGWTQTLQIKDFSGAWTNTIPAFNGNTNWAARMTNMDGSILAASTPSSGAQCYMNLDYEEGIYMGYRYYETAFDEGYLSDYYSRKDGVVYPFGYGLSYTDFEWTIDAADRVIGSSNYDDDINVSVTVKNTGFAAGKDVIEVYSNPPYTASGIEKATANLVDFAKTKLLQPGESQKLNISFPTRYLASFDFKDSNQNGFAGYELEAGDYYVSLRTDSHIIKNLGSSVTDLCEIKFSVATQAVGGKITAVATNGANGFYYDTDEATGTEIRPLFTGSGTWDGTRTGVTADSLTYYDSRRTSFVSPSSPMVEMSRANFATTFPKAPTANDLKMSAGAVNISQSQVLYTSFNDLPTDPWYQAASEFATGGAYESWTQAPNTNDYNAATNPNGTRFDGRTPIQLADMAGLDINDPLWDDFMNQLAYSEMVSMLTNSGTKRTTAFPAIGRLQGSEQDGPACLQGGCFWICEVNIASTYNVDLVYEQGRLVGNEGLFNNIQGWYGPGLNTHRNPMAGRNFEYYSQDGIQGGMIAGAVIKGATSKGLIVYMKHLMLNDQETYRYQVNTFLTEQALREIYCRPWEFAIKEGGAKASMSGFNRIGLMATTSNYNLYVRLLKEEWGFKGITVTDMYGLQYNPQSSGDMGARVQIYPLGTWTNTFGRNIEGTWSETKNTVETTFTQYVTTGTYWYVNDSGAEASVSMGTAEPTGPNATGRRDINIINGGASVSYKNNDTGKMYGKWDAAANGGAGGYTTNGGAALEVYALNDKIDSYTQWYNVRNGAKYMLYTYANSNSIKHGIVGNPLTIGRSGTGNTTTNGNGTGASTSARVIYNFGKDVAGQTFSVAAAAAATNVDTINTTIAGTAAYTVSSGSLPTGMTINATTGAISGTPTASGQYQFAVTVRYNNWIAYTGYYQINVTDPIKTSKTLGTINLGEAFTVDFSPNFVGVSGTPTYAVQSGAAPTGLTLTSAGGIGTLAGTPTAAGTYTFTIRTVASVGGSNRNIDATYTINVVDPAAVIHDHEIEGFEIIGGNLILTYVDGCEENLGNVVGAPGAPGLPGDPGAPGAAGKSAFELWKAIPGNESKTEADFWASLKGAAGDPGAPGNPGADGATWYSGTAAPATATGKEGDFYLNTTTWDVYKKGASGWGTAVGNIKGTAGTNGAPGQDGKDGKDTGCGSSSAAIVALFSLLACAFVVVIKKQF